MTPARIQAAVDQLLARDNSYQPLELLKLSLRLGPAELQRWERGELAFLEDGLAGHPDRIVDLLRVAEAWARKLDLRAEVDGLDATQGQRIFRNGNNERLVRTCWHRRAETQQGDLFFDNRFAVARGKLARSLIAGEAAEAEQHLADMAASDPGNDLQADAEHLVGALAWLDRDIESPAQRLQSIEQDLTPRASRFLGRGDSRAYLARFWRHLAAALDPTEFDPAQPTLHSSALLERFEKPEAVINAILAVADYLEHAELLARLASAGLASGARDVGLSAVCQLCWRHPARAEAWLDVCQDDELVRRVERFWDLEPPLPIELFPAWLVSVAYPLPDIPESELPPGPHPEALVRFRALRQDPANLTLREWFQSHQPQLFNHWLA